MGSSFWATVRTLAAVTAITLLIWLYAESENVRSHEVQFLIELVPPADRPLLIETSQPQPLPVQMTFRSTAGQLAAVQRRVQGAPLRFEVTGGGSDQPSTQTLILKERLATVSPLADLGINIDEVQPATVTARVERLETVTLPVRLDAGGVQVGPALAIEPAEVRLQVRASRAAELAGATAAARPEPARLRALAANEPQVLDAVPVVLPEAVRAAAHGQPTPAAVRVRLTVRKQTDTVTLATVPILVRVPPGALGRFTLALDEDQRVLRDVVLTGPSDVIEAIGSGAVSVTAELRLMLDDLDAAADGGGGTAPVYLEAPAEVTFTPPPPVRFRVARNN